MSMSSHVAALAAMLAMASTLSAQSRPLVVTFTGDILLDRGVRSRIKAAIKREQNGACSDSAEREQTRTEFFEVSKRPKVERKAAIKREQNGTERCDESQRSERKASGGDVLFAHDVDSILAASDIVVGNLECPATNIHAPAYKRFVFRAEPEWLDILRRHHFTHLNLANNHSVDQGRRGLEDTYRQVIRHGMVPVGAAPTAEQAARPVALAPGVLLLPTLRMPLEHFFPLPQEWSVSQDADTTLIRRIRQTRQSHPKAVIIVTPHWGWEHHTRPEPQQRALARAIIDAGADCIIGHHTHTLQRHETYRGRHIFYSIGNFIFDQQRPVNSRAAIVTLTIEGGIIRDVTATHLRIHRCTPHVDSQNRRDVSRRSEIPEKLVRRCHSRTAFAYP